MQSVKFKGLGLSRKHAGWALGSSCGNAANSNAPALRLWPVAPASLQTSNLWPTNVLITVQLLLTCWQPELLGLVCSCVVLEVGHPLATTSLNNLTITSLA